MSPNFSGLEYKLTYLFLSILSLPLFTSAPADYGNINGTFTSCESENQRYPGVYVNSNGQTVT